MIDTYKRYKPPESDISTREAAAARLYWTGDPQNMSAAEAIWKALGTSQAAIESYIKSKPKIG
jgi:chromatin segregation and condensation protein Rec8/ScpA/Scc1 (kleisin family)